MQPHRLWWRSRKRKCYFSAFGQPSKWSSEESTAIPSLPPAGLKTPESTPARISKLRLIPIGHREETKDKPKSSPSLAAISTVAEIPETSEHRLEDIQCKGRPKELKILCNGITVKDKRACTKTVEALHVGQDTGSPLSTLSAVVRSPQRRQSQDAAAKQKPTTPISTTRKSVQCSAQAKSTGLRCRRRIAVTPGTGQLAKDSFQPIYCSSHSTSTALPTPVPSRIHFDPNKVFKVPRLGEDIYVRFCDYIPEYLQPDTQRKLRVAITKKISETDRKPGYVYALNVDDPENKGKLSLKIGYSNNVKKRYAEWKSQCRYMKDIRGWWPETIIKVEDDVEVLIQKLIVGHNTQGNVGPMAAQLERLVHIELKDLVAYAPYLDPNFPDVRPSGAPGFLAKAVPTRKPCSGCRKTPQTHKEIFLFRRAEKGKFVGREWEDIIKPVIRKWGLFLMKYFAEGEA
ncbi:hypothetical protein DFH29DRAFT_907133 [Suillus ampliporus]|nr:hypothetical protein DFH29DRAFT_907133 [Suillus ampliporus]